ncbi:hypothetical protein [Candidatus Palauibacter sp.]|uniref:hypothetical protein n=1 Tax=Candidatus Palauibacter sp. TaxID=3101350 RepID=UPI003AF2A051
MSARTRGQAGAFVAILILYYILHRFVYEPVSGVAVPGWVALIVGGAISVCFLDWVNQTVRSSIRSAVIIAISQAIVVHVYGWLRGETELVTGVVGSVLLIVGWAAVGFVYGKLGGDVHS